MSWLPRPWGLTLGPVLLSLLWTGGCSRPTGLRSDERGAAPDQRQVPLHDGDEGASGNPPAGAASPAQLSGAEPDAGLPFRDAQSLPAGTLLTVRLRNPISGDDPGASTTFEAVVNEPVTIEGNTLVPRGTSVAGRVESVRASEVKPNRGYIRLTLDSIDLAGRNLAIQTSSLFARGNAGENHDPGGDAAAAVTYLKKGRRLTFRLTEPVYLASQRPVPGH